MLSILQLSVSEVGIAIVLLAVLELITAAKALYVSFRSPHPTKPDLAFEIRDGKDVFVYILYWDDDD